MAIAEETLRAIITVEDRTAGALAAIRGRLGAFAALPQHISKRFKELGEETGLAKVGEHAKGAAEHVRRLHGALTDVLRPLGALTAMASFGGIAEAVKSAADLGEHLTLASKATGLSAPQLGGLEYAARLANVPAQSLDRGLGNLNTVIAEAARGKAKDAQIILSRMGLSNTPQHMVAPAAALPVIEDTVRKLAATGQTQLAADMMSKLFGGQRGLRLLPMFEQGSQHLQTLSAQAMATGQAMTDPQAAVAAQFAESYKNMDGAVTGLANSIALTLFPVVTPIIKEMTEWISVNRRWIASDIGDAVKSLADSLKNIKWKAVAADLKSIASAARWVINDVVGVGPALGIIAGARFAPAILAFGRLGVAVSGVAARLLIFPVAGFLASLATLIPTIGSLRDIWLALDLAMDANPIGAVILGVTALSVAGYELYEHWDGVKAFFTDLWDGISAAFESAWKRIKAVFDKIESYLPRLPAWATSWASSGGGAAAAEHYRLTREGKLGATVAPYAATPAESIFLRDLARGEAKSYSELYGGGSLKGLPTDQYGFPLWAGRMGPGGKMTHAAGLYQFEPGTWDAEAQKLGLKDFSAKSQDMAAWDLAATTYAERQRRDLAADLAAGRVKDIAGVLHDQWTSTGPALTSRLSHDIAALSKPLGRTASSPGTTTIEHQHSTRVALDFKNLPRNVQPQVETGGEPFDLGLGYSFGGY